jgi:hypothetical protein
MASDSLYIDIFVTIYVRHLYRSGLLVTCCIDRLVYISNGRLDPAH